MLPLPQREPSKDVTADRTHDPFLSCHAALRDHEALDSN